MNHIKSTISRSLRRNSPVILTFRARRSAVRNIASTSRNATSLDVRNSEPQPSPTVFYSRNTSVLPSTMVKQAVDGFTHLVTSLTHTLTRPTGPPSVPELIRIMAAYDSDEPSWERFAIGDESKQYTRNLVIEVPGVFNLLMLVWSPGKASPIHDHVDSHCVMKVMRGKLTENRYEWPSEETGKMVKSANKRYSMGKVAYMCDRMGLHSIGNPSSTEYAYSLHLYTPPNAAMRGCYKFDEKTGERTHVQQEYDSVCGKVISRH